MYDDNGHGTHICGIISGSGKMSAGKYAGIAPCTRLVVGKVLDESGGGAAEDMLEALRWILSVRERYQIRILNISVGIGILAQKDKERLLQEQLEKIWDSGVVVVCAAGNKGPEDGSISSIGIGKKVITVGCHDGEFCRKNPRRCETYSGRGEAAALFRKPDIVAPGTDIVSCRVCSVRQSGGDEYYVAKSGTSMATPIVTGAIALALQRYPWLSNEEVRSRLIYTAADLGEPWNKQGWGMVNVRGLLA